MKQKLLALLVASAAPLLALPAQAGVLALADMDVNGIGFLTPGVSSLTITNEQRTGNASATYNGVPLSANGSVNGANTLNVAAQCVGACGAAAGLYTPLNVLNTNGYENAFGHIGSPPTQNFALGDMYISGSALVGSGPPVRGLTRADSSSSGPTNTGSGNSTIFNGGRITGTFTSGSTFTSALFVSVNAFMQTYVDPANPATESASAGAGFGWVMKVTGPGVNLTFSPADLNQTSYTTDPSGNFVFDTLGYKVYNSAVATYTAGALYNFSINQSSNSTINDIPEPASLALIGVGLLGLGFASRRRAK